MSLLEPILIGLLVGLVVGALGAGGGILSVPILVYALQQPPHSAAASSLVIVGFTAMTGLIFPVRERLVPAEIAASRAEIELPCASTSRASCKASTASRRIWTSCGSSPCLRLSFRMPRAPFQSPSLVDNSSSVFWISTWRGFSA